MKLFCLTVIIFLYSCKTGYNNVNLYYDDEFHKWEYEFKENYHLIHFSNGFTNDSIIILRKGFAPEELVLTSIKNLSITGETYKVLKPKKGETIKIKSKDNTKSIKIKIDRNYKVMYLSWLPKEGKWSLTYDNQLHKAM